MAGQTETMWAARLHGPRDLRVERMARPVAPKPGEVIVRVTAAGICGSDLHTYMDGRIGDTVVQSPMILGHEFAGRIEAVGAQAHDGMGRPLRPGLRVAVDPAQPCGTCELCQRGDPNLCLKIHFCGTYPDDGCFCEYIRMPAHTCFPVSDAIDDETAVLLEPLGIALHAIDLSRIRVGSSVAILGAGPIGLCLLQVAKLAGAGPIFVSDRFPWRLELARKLGGVPVDANGNPVQSIMQATAGRGVDTAIEAAWADDSIQQAVELARYGGTVALVGIPGRDELHIKHSTARRKGLTIMLVRRAKNVYPRAVSLAERGAVDLKCLVSHRVTLDQTAAAFELNAAYRDNVVKIIIK